MSDQGIPLHCPACQKTLKIQPDWRGRRLRCPNCKTVVSPSNDLASLVLVEAAVPAPAPAPAPAAAPPAAASDLYQLDDAGAGHAAHASHAHHPHAPHRPAGKSAAPLIVGVGVLLVVIVAAVMAFVFVGGGGGGGGAAMNEAFAFIPHDPRIVVSVNVKEVMNSTFYQEIKKENDEFEKEAKKEMGIDLNDVVSATFGGDPNSEEFVALFKTAKPMKADDMKKNREFATAKEEKVGDRTAHFGRKSGFCIIDDSTMLVGEGKALRDALKRSSEKTKISQTLSRALDQLDSSATARMAVDVTALIPAGEGDGQGGGGGGFPGFAMPILALANVAIAAPRPVLAQPRFMRDLPMDMEQLSSIKAVAASGSVSRSISLKLVVICKDDKAASELQKMADGLLVMGKSGIDQQMKRVGAEEKKMMEKVKEIIDAVKITASGDTVRASAEADVLDLVKEAMAQQKKRMEQYRQPPPQPPTNNFKF